MRKRALVAVVSAALLMFALANASLAAPAAFAAPGGNVTCNGNLPAGTYGNVTAEAGCGLGSGVVVTGNVTVAQGGTLGAGGGASIAGNLTAINADWIVIAEELSVGGNVQIQGLTGAIPSPAAGRNLLCGMTVRGNVEVDNTAAAAGQVLIGNSIECKDAPGSLGSIGGNVLVQGNAAEVDVTGSIIGGNLQVQNNSGGNFVGNNTAKGNIQVDNTNDDSALFYPKVTESNSAGGNCEFSNNPGMLGYLNTARGHNTCNPDAGVIGTVTPTNTFPVGTNFGVAACPGSSAPSLGCPGLLLSTIDSSGGPYSIGLPPGTYSIEGFANGTPTMPFLVGADQPYVVETVSAGEVLTLNWTVTYP